MVKLYQILFICYKIVRKATEFFYQLIRFCRNYFMKKYLIILLFFAMLCGCQTCKNYHDTLIETSLISEIPTLIGNLLGGAVAVPTLLITAPIALTKYPELDEDATIEEKKLQQEKKENFMLAPMYFTSTTFGIILGTPFYPLGLLFPRDLPEEELE